MRVIMGNENIDILKKELKFTRICCMVSSILTICLLAAVIILFTKLQPVYEFMNTAKPVMEKISEVDVNSLNETIGTLNETMGEVDWEGLSDSIDALDVEAINKVIESYDPEEFSRTLDNLNSAIEMIGTLSQKFGSLSSIF